MKKIIIYSLLVSFLSLGFALPVLADEATSTPPAANQPAESESSPALPATVQAVYKPRQVVMNGEITAISAKTIPSDVTLKLTRVIPVKVRNFSGVYPQKDASVIVHLNEKTKVVRKYMGKADISELAVGDKAMVTGKLNADGTVIAQLFKDNSIHVTFNARRGEVLIIDATNQTFNIKNEKNKEFKIFVTLNTKFAKRGMEKPGFADLKAGDKAAVRGVIRQAANEITADSVVIHVSKEEMATKQLEAKKAVAFKALEKKKTNLIKQLEKKKTQLEKKIEKVKGKALENAQKELEDVDKKLGELPDNGSVTPVPAPVVTSTQ